MNKEIINHSVYKIRKGKIVKIKQLTDQEKFFEVALQDGDLGHDPGQFVEVSIFGVGEAPISVSSSPTKHGTFDMCVRNSGKVTGAMHNLKEGDELGIRGPFGKGFPVKLLQGNDLVFVAAGLGIVPLRALINFAIDNRRDFGKVSILLGCKTPQNILFGDELESWQKRLDINFACTVDKADPDWKGNVGLITTLIPGVNMRPNKTYAVVVGPPIMYKFVIAELLSKNIPEKQILVSLERHMKCGIGKCGHCQIQNYYCCQEGPVFSYDKIKEIKEAI